MHVGLFVSLGLAIFAALMVRNTKLGYEMRVIGHNEKAAHFAGMAVARNIVIVMLICGALAGISGAIEVTGSTHRLNSVISNSYGYSGIIVAVLAGSSPLALVPVAFLYAVLLNAGIVLQTQGLSVNLVTAITGFILVLASIGEVAAKYRIVRVDKNSVMALHSVAGSEGTSAMDQDTARSYLDDF
jgi:simple sugar transport system permease protein